MYIYYIIIIYKEIKGAPTEQYTTENGLKQFKKKYFLQIGTRFFFFFSGVAWIKSYLILYTNANIC